ncbi:MAG TPA: response regulator [Roseiflexaceae bacterium]|nr:response regulator [Roseiflexaceae bacterium]HMP39280.1 response regulator [Roseiflexaceae bacterium]
MLPHTILIVDDAPEHRDILVRLLRASGYRVLEATPGSEAVTQALAAQPDLILMNLALPWQPAWEITRHLHALPALAGVPILGATLFPTLVTRTLARNAGYVDYVEKPFEFDLLLDRISELLSGTPMMSLA